MTDFQYKRRDLLLYNNPIYSKTRREDYREYFKCKIGKKALQIKKVLKDYIRDRDLRPDLLDPYEGWADIHSYDLEAFEENRLNKTAEDFKIVF